MAWFMQFPPACNWKDLGVGGWNQKQTKQEQQITFSFNRGFLKTRKWKMLDPNFFFLIANKNLLAKSFAYDSLTGSTLPANL
jgi:hypothetical protein